MLGAALLPGGQPGPALLRRVLHGAELFRQGRGRHLLLSGGAGRFLPSEAAVMRRIALEHGVPEACIVLEERARDTLENALFSAAILRQHGWTRIVLVTERYHLPRAWLAFRAAGVHLAACSVAPDRGDAPWWKYGLRLLREATALAWYSLRLLRRRTLGPGGADP